MPFVSLTRLRLRSVRFLLPFFRQTRQAIKQARHARGFQTGALLADRRLTFWTMTAWDSHEAMREYMISGPHKTAMPFLLEWCDEASVAHWDQPDETLPSWTIANGRMRESGRPSKVKSPSPRHANLTYRVSKVTVGGPILKA